MKDADVVQVNKETTLHLADHERLLSFNGDDDAVTFDDWWFDVGFDAYLKYRKQETE